MQEQLPDSSSLEVSISLARLKLSTIKKITSSKQVKKSFFKLCTPPPGKSKMDNTNDITPKKPVVQMNSKCIIRKSDKPAVDNNAPKQTEGSEMVNIKFEPVSKSSEEELCYIVEEYTTLPDTQAINSQKNANPLNKHISAKHNLPVFMPPRRNEATAAKKRDAITQTSKVHIVSEADFIRLKYMQYKSSSKFQKSSYTQTDDTEVKKTANDDVNNYNKSCTANDETVNKLLSHSDKNKALLNQFYKLPHKPPTKRIDHINVSNVINQVLIKIHEQYQESGIKLYYNKMTQTKISSYDYNTLFSPVSEDEAPSSAVAELGANNPDLERNVPDSSIQCRSLPSTPAVPVVEAASDQPMIPNQYYHNRPHAHTSTYPNTSDMMISALQLREQHQACMPPSVPTNSNKSSSTFPAAQNVVQQSGEVAMQVSQYPQEQQQRQQAPLSGVSAPTLRGRGGGNLRQMRRGKSLGRHGNAPYLRAPCPQTCENYNSMMYQHKIHDFEMQQRAWGQLQNYPNSSWLQNMQSNNRSQ